MTFALLFDLDGTLVDTNPLHFLAWQAMLTEQGMTLDLPGYQARISGRTNQQILADLLPTLTTDEAIQFAEDKEAQFRHLLADLQPLAGLEDLLDTIAQAGGRTAIVTNAPRRNAEAVLTRLRLHDAFDTIVLAEDAPPGKPHPAPYRLGLERLNVAADRAIAFEDSPSGIRSAVAAGIATLGITTSHPAEELLAAGCERAIADFQAFSLAQWLGELVVFRE
jgi:HAD superfamily hydrolase (TIGR01509 family)